MSNCIELHNGIIEPNISELDIPRLKALLERVKDLKDAPDPTTDNEGYTAWWWLSNTVFLRSGHNVVIGLGHGRSAHTFRDFKGTLRLLSQMMKRSKLINLRYTEDDGRNEKEWIRIDLSMGWPEPALA